MNYYQHHIGDFIRDTSRLTDSQCMAYLRLIWMYYDNEQPLPNNPRILAFKVGATVDDVSLILEAFFVLDDAVWRHSRCDAEIADYWKFCEAQKAKGKKGGRPKNNLNTANTDAAMAKNYINNALKEIQTEKVHSL